MIEPQFIKKLRERIVKTPEYKENYKLIGKEYDVTPRNYKSDYYYRHKDTIRPTQKKYYNEHRDEINRKQRERYKVDEIYRQKLRANLNKWKEKRRN